MSPGIRDHHGSVYAFAVMASSTGKVNWKVAPRSGLPVAHKPRCASIIERLSDRPMPVPWGFVVKNGSKTLSARSEGNPMPASLTEISTRSSGFRCDLIVRCAEPPLKPRVNQIVKDQQFLRQLHIKTAVQARQPDQNASSS